ncbi:hypothetical protein CTKZ_25000 [Cellulomonas algicola]|uniref:Uncharacterized protein n=1 Tax=Cellulomonas algicola TaxID=2071633 RepID=A0A401V1Z0_9CELL|nr:hypothetical protein [Cellulomonas algicola]GCD20938.1 hypothetical protein CTKZ_25000 [Cellulomonas algicola]
MNVTWAATSPTTGRFDALERTTDVADLARRVGELRLRGNGYLEVRAVDDFPVLTLGFHEGVAVVHLFRDAETVCLLAEATGRTDSAMLPVMDDWTEFRAPFVHDLDHAWELVQQFSDGIDVARLGSWSALQPVGRNDEGPHVRIVVRVGPFDWR